MASPLRALLHHKSEYKILSLLKNNRMSRSFSSSTDNNVPPIEDEVLVERLKGKKVLTLNRPRALNALNLPMVRKMYNELKPNRESKTPDLVIVKGTGSKAFCAGGDVVAVSRSYKEGSSSTYWRDFFHDEYRLNYLIGTLPMPYIAFMDGITMGGGCGVSIHGRFRVATERTMLAMPETALGLFPDVGGTHFLSRLPHQLGLFLALTGHRLMGADVLHAHLATHYIPSGELIRVEEALLDLPKVECTPEGVDAVLRRFRPKPDDVPPFTLKPHIETIKHCFSASSMEEVLVKLRKNGSTFAQQQIQELNKMSPTSLKVTFRQVSEGHRLPFADVFPMEFRMVNRFMAGHDFHEGCRAILIDKDRKPKWRPAMVEDVKDEDVDAYFAPFADPGQELVLDRGPLSGKAGNDK